MLEAEGLPVTDENIFIAASCKEKGILYLTGKAQPNGIYKIDREAEAAKAKGEYTVKVGGKPFAVKLAAGKATVNGVEYPVNVDYGIKEVAVEEAKESTASSDAPAVASNVEATTVKAPMPGLILRIEVKEGQKVGKNQLLLIMEAMKMENEIYAPCEGVVTKISVTQGQQLQSDDDLLVIG